MNSFTHTISFTKKIFKKEPFAVLFLSLFILVGGGFEGISFGLFLPLIKIITSTTNSLPSNLWNNVIMRTFELLHIHNVIGGILFSLVVAFAVKNAALYFQKWYAAKISIDFEIDLKKNIVSSLFLTDWQFYLKEKTGNLLNAIGHESKFAANAFQMLSLLCSEFVNVFVYCIVGFFISWKAFGISLIAGIISFSLLKNLVRYSRTVGLKTVDLKNACQGSVLENFIGMKFVKGNRLEEGRQTKIFSLFEQLGRVELKGFQYLAIVETFPDFLMACLICVILFLSYSYLKVPGENLLVLIVILYRLNRRLISLQTMVQRLMIYLPSFELCENIAQNATNKKERTGSGHFEHLIHDISLQDVGFEYENHPVLQRINLKITKNQYTAIVGKSGSGKTTILDLILGLLSAQRGFVTIDGVDIKNYDIFSWRKRIGYIPQEPFLINGTIRENIALEQDLFKDSDIVCAAKMAYAHDFIEKQPDGYLTIVGDRGAKLSGGQRQRIALARALLRAPDILILDEATNALDAESEQMVQKTIANLKGKMTILVVAHRLTTIEQADFIYVLDEGQIVQAGTSNFLMSQTGLFNHLYKGDNP
jgi:ATP-binding cassette subfamily C protein